MAGLWYAAIAVLIAYVLFCKPFKLASAMLSLTAVRRVLGVALLLASGFSAYVGGAFLSLFAHLAKSGPPIGSFATLLLFDLAVAYVGIRLIARKSAAARPRRVRSKVHQREPVELPVLREVPDTAQVEGEPPRRWFFSHEQDLLVWFGPDGAPSAFQLAYGKYRDEHALRWKVGRGFEHYAVEDGERTGVSKQAPLLEPDGLFPASSVLNRFLELSAEIPKEIADFIALRLREHPEYHSGSEARPSPGS
jgi:hypothetical protein